MSADASKRFSEIQREVYRHGYDRGREEAIDEFYAKCREEYWYSSQFMEFFEMTRKKLKAGGKNDVN